MKAIKCVWQYHNKKDDLVHIFEYFRYCANEAIRIGIEDNLTSKFQLHYRLYHKLRTDSKFYSRYTYGALECAAARLRLYRKTLKKKPDAKIPYVSRNHAILDNQSYKIEGDAIRITTEPRKYLYIRLSDYVGEKIGSAKLGSLTMTDDKIIISYSKDIPRKRPSSFIGIDRNLDNITTCDSGGKIIMYDLSEAQRIISSCNVAKSNFRRNDVRIRRRIFQKYGRLQRNRVHNLLHNVSKSIMSQNSGIILEDIKGIRKLYRKGNGQGKKYRRRMNSWSFYELQRQVEYKARWLGLPVKYVRAGGTSSKCAVCGSKLVPEGHRMMYCATCKVVVDRDVNAARNILLRGTQAVPDGAAGEAVMAEPGRMQPVICRVDAAKLGCRIFVPIT